MPHGRGTTNCATAFPARRASGSDDLRARRPGFGTRPLAQSQAEALASPPSTLAARPPQLQLLDIADYEKLLGLAEAGEDILVMLARKAAGPFRERDLAAWLHGDRAAPSDESRPSRLESRWEEIGDRVTQMAKLATDATGQDPAGA